MPSFLYEYKCDWCGHVLLHRERANEIEEEHYDTLGRCPNKRMRRVWSFAMHRPMQEHFNHTVGKPIRTMQQFKDELQRKGEQYSEYTGLDTNYQPVDMTDTKALGITGEGLDSTNEQRMKRGLRPISPD